MDFEELDPAAQQAYCLAELEALEGRLQTMLARSDAIRVEMTDPDNMVRLTLGSDGRLLALWIADDAPRRLSNIELEDRINDLIGAGWEAVTEMRALTVRP